MILGIDISTYLEQQKYAHQKFYKDGEVFDPITLFKNQGVSHIRTRIWNNPYDNNGEPYLGGTCDLDNLINLYHTLKKYDFKYVIDFHYSDFWVDPSKQYLPKAWEHLSFDEIVEQVYLFTKESLLRCKKEEMDVTHVQIGNEITHGMLWPHASLIEQDNREERFKKLSIILNSGIKAVKEIYPNAQIIIHLERSYDIACYDEYVGELIKNDVNFDILGSSYYPFWHRGFKEYFACQDMVRSKYHKKVMNVEFGFPFTLDDYLTNDELNGKHMVINEDNVIEFHKYLPYEISKDGQKQFMRDFINEAKKHQFEGVFYWEPLWVPGNNICWSSLEAQRYQRLTVLKDPRNEWANQCLFDYDANMNPAVLEYKL